jgi:hypothetical protein
MRLSYGATPDAAITDPTHVPDPTGPALPPSERLNIAALAGLFRHTTNSYKFVYFLALLEQHRPRARIRDARHRQRPLRRRPITRHHHMDAMRARSRVAAAGASIQPAPSRVKRQRVGCGEERTASLDDAAVRCRSPHPGCDRVQHAAPCRGTGDLAYYALVSIQLPRICGASTQVI